MKIVDLNPRPTKQEWQAIHKVVAAKIRQGKKLPFIVRHDDDALPEECQGCYDYYAIEMPGGQNQYLIGAVYNAYAVIHNIEGPQALIKNATMLGEGNFGEVRKVLWEDGSVSAVKKLKTAPESMKMFPAVYNYQITEVVPVAADDMTISFYYNQGTSTWEAYKGPQRVLALNGVGYACSKVLSNIVEQDYSRTHLEDHSPFVMALKGNQKRLDEIICPGSAFEIAEVHALRKLGYLKAHVEISATREELEAQYLIFQTLFKGETIKDLFTSGFMNDISRSEIIRAGYLIACVVAGLQERNILQMDFNPGNFIINYFKTAIGAVSAIDFGQAQIIELDQERLQQKKQYNTNELKIFLMIEFNKTRVFEFMSPTEKVIYDRLQGSVYHDIYQLLGDLSDLYHLVYQQENELTKTKIARQVRTFDFVNERRSKPLAIQDDGKLDDKSPTKIQDRHKVQDDMLYNPKPKGGGMF